MFCTHCGKELDGNAVVCPRCGCPTGNYYRQATPAAPQKQSNGLAVAGFVLSIFSLWFGALFCIVPIIALALSASGLKASKKENSGGGLAAAGLTISIITTLLWGIFYLVAIIVYAA